MNWHPMTADDLAAVANIADRVHPTYPEDAAVFAERLHLYPDGCYVLRSADGGAAGYAITHPWLLGKPPALNILLTRIPPAADTYYIHDIALLEQARGGGMASWIIRKLIGHAATAGFSNASLVAANNSVPFWTGHAFRVVNDDALRDKLRSYDDRAAYMVRELA